MKSKVELRSELKAARAEMSVAEVIEKSRLIVAGAHTILTSLNFGSLHCYEPIAKLHEVDVSELFDMPDVALYTSRKLNDEWHVVSVIDNIAKPDTALDVIIVPMLGFDKNLHRVGYGGGYYDQLLAKYPKALRIGVCYEQGRVEAIPSEPHDMPLNIIVTEETASIAV
jgi:5,10-methenyltetrahydrofolate synthetase